MNGRYIEIEYQCRKYILYLVSLRRCLAGRHTLMVVRTSTGNLGTVLSNTPDRPASETITDGGVAMIPLPDRGRTLADERIWHVHRTVMMPETKKKLDDCNRTGAHSYPVPPLDCFCIP